MRLASVVQVGLLLLSVVAADRLSRGVRGAMCAYGVFGSNEWGSRALLASAIVAVAAGTLSRFYAFDGQVRGLELARPLAIATLALAPLAMVDLALTGLFFDRLDLGVTASCCSVQLDAAVSASAFASGPRDLVAVVAPACVGLTILVGFVAARRPRRALVTFAAALSLGSLPLAVAAAVLEVAPHAFEVPSHLCPFCLLKRDAGFLGYPLFAAMLAAVIWSVGAGTAAVFARRSASTHDAFHRFAASSMRRGAVAWLVAVTIGIAPIVRYTVLSGGASLFR